MNCNYCALEKDSLLHINGPDSLTFLQGQTTCDTREVNADHALPGAYCTPKGRVVCDFLLSQLGPDHFALRMRHNIRAVSKAVFGKYIIFSKAELDDTRDDWRSFAFWGANAGAELAKIFGSAPDARYECSSTATSVLVQMDEQGQHFEGYINLASDPELLNKIEEQLTLLPENEWQATQIASGVARIEAATVEEFVPQTVNYDLTGHISFSKGCYTGQEVVARLHYRGTPKRRTYLAELPSNVAGEAGQAVYSEEKNQSVGDIVNAASTLDKSLVLVSATAAGAASGLHLGASDGPLLAMMELPYSLATD